MVFVGSEACVHGFVLDKVNKGQWDSPVQVHPKTTMFWHMVCMQRNNLLPGFVFRQYEII